MSGSPITRFLRQLERHVFSAILTGVGVMLLASGLFAYVLPLGAVAGGSSPTPDASTPAAPLPSFASAAPPGSVAPSPSPSATTSPGPSGSAAIATRVVIPALRIDLPVISGDSEKLGANGQPFPYCNVAEYMTAFSQPGSPGTTYIYAHARTGMFLPILEAAQVDNGASMLGYSVLVYTSDAKVYWYSVASVKRHVHDFSLAYGLAKGAQQLILQTSETPYSWGTKMQVQAKFELVQPAGFADSHPTPHPIVCS